MTMKERQISAKYLKLTPYSIPKYCLHLYHWILNKSKSPTGQSGQTRVKCFTKVAITGDKETKKEMIDKSSKAVVILTAETRYNSC